MTIKSYLDYTGLKRVLKRLLPGARKIWHGTAEEWHGLSDEERNKYDQAEVVDGSGYEETTIMPLIDAKPTCRDVDGNLVKNQKIVELTKEQYDALAVKDPDTYYMINDDNNKAKTWYPHPDWANAVTISADQLYAGYTAPSDGMFVCSGVMPTVGYSHDKEITVNNICIVRGQCTEASLYSYGDCSCPVSEGDLIKSSTSSAWSNEKRYFVPWK